MWPLRLPHLPLFSLLSEYKQSSMPSANSQKSEEQLSLFMLRRWSWSHHHGLIRLQISDRKSVNHTTEMIL